MEVQTRNGLIAVGITMGLLTAGYLIYEHFTKDVGNNEFKDNFDSLQSNIGIKAGKDNIVVVPFNVQNNTPKNLAQFYSNDRVIIFNNLTKLPILKGSYSNGGKNIKTDNGIEAVSSSVYTNLSLLIK